MRARADLMICSSEHCLGVVLYRSKLAMQLDLRESQPLCARYGRLAACT